MHDPSRRPLVLAVLALVLAAAPGCFATRAVGLGPDPGPGEPLKGDPPEVVYQKAKQMFQARDWKPAGEAFGQVWRDHPESPFAADARFYEAECRYGMEKWNGAFVLYQGFLKTQPLSPHAPLIERRLYDMGVYLVDDGEHGFFDTSGEGIEVLEYLVGVFPNGDLSDDALLHIARHAMRHRRPQDAVIGLHDLLDHYPGSEWAYEARLRLAKAYREMNRGSRYDADALRRAAAQYRAYIEIVSADSARAGEHARGIEEARYELREVEETLGTKGLEEAEFYLYDGRAEAARAALRNVIRAYPGSDAAAEARRRLGGDRSK